MTTTSPKNTAPTGEKTRRVRAGSSRVTEARAAAQLVKLDDQAKAREREAAEAKEAAALRSARGKKEQKQERLQASRRASTTIARAVDDYLLDHEGGNHSAKTLEWHRTALGLMRTYFEKERGITRAGEVDAADMNAWFAHMRKSPGGHGKPRSERTIQTYARSARAFFHWLVRRETIERNPFDRASHTTRNPSMLVRMIGRRVFMIVEPFYLTGRWGHSPPERACQREK